MIMSKIRNIYAVLMMLVALSGNAYDGVSKLFVEEKGDLFNTLTLATRYELLNNYGRADKSEVINDLRTNESRILNLDKDYMKIATSAGATVEIKLLYKSKTDTVVAVIETVATPYKDSRITFYDTKWQKLETSTFFDVPTIADFFLPSAPKAIREELVNWLDMTMIEMRFEGSTLVAQCNAQDFFMGEDFKRYKPYMTQKVVYTINKAKFKKK